MVDPVTVVGAGLAVIGSKDLLNKVLGPTAEYLGLKTAGLVEKCDVNLDGIFTRAFRKLGSRAEQPGAVNARVLRHVVEDGRFVEDELVSEYYGGMLASSKTPNGSDDRGLPHLARVQGMSVYQIRLHFLIYISMVRTFQGEEINVGDNQARRRLKLFLPYSSINKALQPESPEAFQSSFAHSIHGLYASGLVEDYTYGPMEHVKKDFPAAPSGGLIVAPTFIGAELFLWALGVSDPYGHDLLFQDLTSVNEPIIVERTAIRLIPPQPPAASPVPAQDG